VDTIVTELSVIDVTPEGLLLKEIRPGITVEDVQRLTQPGLMVPGDVKKMEF
jgi:3-oxoacid CoA-transferase subunit B